jgi:hypothetical protein
MDDQDNNSGWQIENTSSALKVIPTYDSCINFLAFYKDQNLLNLFVKPANKEKSLFSELQHLSNMYIPESFVAKNEENNCEILSALHESRAIPDSILERIAQELKINDFNVGHNEPKLISLSQKTETSVSCSIHDSVKVESFSKADLETEKKVSTAALHNAAKLRNLEQVRLLVQNPLVELDAFNVEGKTALHLVTGYNPQLPSALQHTNAGEITKLLLDAGANPDKYSRYGESALFYAVKHAKSEAVEHLLAAGANINNIDTKSSMTALQFAVLNGHNTIIKILLDYQKSREAGSQVSSAMEKSYSNRVLRGEEAKKLPIFNNIYQCIYSGTPDSLTWNLGEFTRKEGEDYVIVTAKFPKRDYRILTPSPTAIGLWSKDAFILVAVTSSFDCSIGKNNETVYRPKEINKWFAVDNVIKRDWMRTGNQYNESRAKFSESALEAFDQLVNSL